MNSKTETPATGKAKSVAETGAKTAAVETAQEPAAAPAAIPSESEKVSAVPSAPQKPTTKQANDLSPAHLELLTELRDTVKGLNPRKHTPKTLRRALSNVSDILADIDKLYESD